MHSTRGVERRSPYFVEPTQVCTYELSTVISESLKNMIVNHHPCYITHANEAAIVHTTAILYLKRNIEIRKTTFFGKNVDVDVEKKLQREISKYDSKVQRDKESR